MRTAYALHTRLLPKPGRDAPSLEIGVVDLERRTDAVTAALQIAGAVGLPLEKAEAEDVADDLEDADA